MKVKAYIHSLKDTANHRHVLGEAEIIERIGDNEYLAKYNGVMCMAVFNPFVGRYFIDDVYGVQDKVPDANPANRFQVTITETLKMNIEVEADNPEQAEEVASAAWKSSKIILDADNYAGVEFRAVPIDEQTEATK